MSGPGPQDQLDEATVDLLVKQVIEGLSPAELRVLDVQDRATTSAYLRDLERAAAAACLAAPTLALPSALRSRLQEAAEAQVASAPTLRAVPTPVSPTVAPSGPASSGPRRPALSGNLGWFAAAACLLLALFGWVRSPQPLAPPVADVTVVAPPAPPPAPKEPTPAEARDALMAKQGVLKVTLGSTKDPAAAGATGDVVWDPVTQTGYLHFVGLSPNDPQVHQYQVWIFDGERDKRYPIDGGVFDVPATAGDIVIPIRAELMVHKPAAFAVTVEKPGGAVVSTRDHVIALGAVAG